MVPRRCRFLSGWVSGLVLGLAVVNAARAETAAEKLRGAAQLVQDALASEIAGPPSERGALLQAALEKAPSYAPALWQTGHVQLPHGWVKFDEVPAIASRDGHLATYRAMRDRYPATVEGQMALARWCAAHKLPDQQRAHLTQVLAREPDNQEARRLLGDRYVNGTWLSGEEFQRLSGRAADDAEAETRWDQKLRKLCADLSHHSLLRQRAAAASLAAIRDPAAIPAIDEVLFDSSPQAARLAVDVLAPMNDLRASGVLARYAVFSPWQSVRRAAAESLKPRDMDGYVPLLLSAMASPLVAQTQLLGTRRGQPVYGLEYSRERQYHQEVVSLTPGATRMAPPPGSTSSAAPAAPPPAALPRARAATSLAQAAVTGQNASTEAVNQRIAETLAVATGQNGLVTPDQWWQWWNERNEVSLAGAKSVRAIVAPRYIGLVRAEPKLPAILEEPEMAQQQPLPLALSQPFPLALSRPFPLGQPQSFPPGQSQSPTFGLPLPPSAAPHECLAAGTPAWTDRGAVPIEQVRPGDRVLSQDLESGRLAYKPVLNTTIRPSTRLTRIDLKGQSMRTTGGHPFWVSGQGWVKASDLRPGMRLHTVSGSVDVDSAGPADSAETYNLVVADYHTYFAGPDYALTHDNTIRRATNSALPGAHK